MNKLQDTLPDLMRRATDDLVPDSPDLVERGIRRGVVLRRRRRALAGVAATTAVLVSGGAVVAGQLIGGPADPGPAVAGKPSAALGTGPVGTRPTDRTAVEVAQAVRTLETLLPDGVRVIGPKGSREPGGEMVAVTAQLDDGKGRVDLDLTIGTDTHSPRGNQSWSCADRPERCTVLPDGSALSWSQPDSSQNRKNGPGGELIHLAVIQHPNGTGLAITVTNGIRHGDPRHSTFERTRSKPVLTVAQLKVIAKSRTWHFPPAR